ncbi:MAG: O-antigen ligase family protein, partial [Ktedonobacterales bacterium]|nr:O-antigen ligase family protein [Ktedonobacterales bacterium]
RMVLFVAICSMSVIIAARLLLVPFFASSYLPALTPLWLLLPSVFGFTVYKTLYGYLLGRGKPTVGVFSAGSALLVTIALDLLLIPRLGIAGAAIASSVAYCVNGLIVLIVFSRASGIALADALVVRRSDLVELRDDAARFLRRLEQPHSRVRRAAGRGVPPVAPRWLAAMRERTRGLWIWLGVGMVIAAWVGMLVSQLNPTLFMLALVLGLALLALTNRLWLGAALLVSDITLTDYYPPFASSLSLRTLLAGAMVFAVLLALAQRRATLSPSTARMLVAITVFFLLATASNLLKGGATLTFLRHSLAGAAALIFLATLIRRKRDLLFVLAPGALVALLSASTAFLQVFAHSPATLASAAAQAAYGARGFGLSQTPIAFGNGLALLAVVLSGLLLYGRPSRPQALAGWLLVVVLAAGAITSGSRSVLLAMELAAAVLALGQRLRLRIILLVAVVLLVGGTLKLTAASAGRGNLTLGGGDASLVGRSAGDTEISTGSRLVLWQAGLLMVADHPVFGIGYDRYLSLAPLYQPRVDAQLLDERGVGGTLGRYFPHNDFLNVWLSFGTFAFLAFLWIYLIGITAAWRTWKRARDPWLRAMAIGCLAALMAYSVHASLHNAYDDSLLLWILLGLLLALEKLATMAHDARRPA